MRLEVEALGVTFQNPVLLAAGTCGFGREVSEVVDLEGLGGFVTKSVTVEPRSGNPPLRLTEFDGGMLNSVGLANPGLEGARRDKLSWIRDHVRRAKVLVSIAGHRTEEYPALVEGLDDLEGFLGYEVNLSCPNDAKLGGLPFALDPDAVAEVISACRARTERPLVVKLAPNDLDLARTVRAAGDAGADALTLVNTAPGLLLRASDGTTQLGAGPGGMSGPALRPLGLKAVATGRAATGLPIFGVGGILAADDAVAYARAGATLVQMGTATFAAPRAAERLVRDLRRWGSKHGVATWTELGEEEGAWPK